MITTALLIAYTAWLVSLPPMWSATLWEDERQLTRHLLDRWTVAVIRSGGWLTLEVSNDLRIDGRSGKLIQFLVGIGADGDYPIRPWPTVHRESGKFAVREGHDRDEAVGIGWLGLVVQRRVVEATDAT